MSRPVIDHANGTALDALDSIADATAEQHAAARRVMERHGAGDLLEYLFGTPHREGDREKLRKQAQRRAQKPVRDPATSQHPPEQIETFRAQVAAFGREDGRWPDVDAHKPSPPDLLAAYRAAHAEPKPEPATRPYNGPSPEAVALRARMRDFGRANGLPYSSHGTPNPRLVAAYYEANPEEKP